MKKIILVEDDLSIREAFEVIFQEPQYKLISYDNGDELLKNNYELPDLFILDKQLPGKDGLDICRHLKSDNQSKKIRVLMISANPNIEQLTKSAGADELLVKPFRLADLRNIVNKYIPQLQ